MADTERLLRLTIAQMRVETKGSPEWVAHAVEVTEYAEALIGLLHSASTEAALIKIDTLQAMKDRAGRAEAEVTRLQHLIDETTGA